MVPPLLRTILVLPWKRQHEDAALPSDWLSSGALIGSAASFNVPLKIVELGAFAVEHCHRPSAWASRTPSPTGASVSIASADVTPKVGAPHTSSGSTTCTGPLTAS